MLYLSEYLFLVDIAVYTITLYNYRIEGCMYLMVFYEPAKFITHVLQKKFRQHRASEMCLNDMFDSIKIIRDNKKQDDSTFRKAVMVLIYERTGNDFNSIIQYFKHLGMIELIQESKYVYYVPEGKEEEFMEYVKDLTDLSTTMLKDACTQYTLFMSHRIDHRQNNKFEMMLLNHLRNYSK